MHFAESPAWRNFLCGRFSQTVRRKERNVDKPASVIYCLKAIHYRLSQLVINYIFPTSVEGKKGTGCTFYRDRDLYSLIYLIHLGQMNSSVDLIPCLISSLFFFALPPPTSPSLPPRQHQVRFTEREIGPSLIQQDGKFLTLALYLAGGLIKFINQ